MTVMNKLISEFEDIKKNHCKNIQELIFFDGVLSIIESKYLDMEKEQMIDCFLTGKLDSEGDSYSPLKSTDIAEKWFEERYGKKQ